jgi:heme-degrading monooxygenase HmoA
MSVMIEMRMNADASRVEQAARDNHDMLMAIGDRAKQQGCVHHRFYAENGQIVVVDEWQDAESFQKFFSSDPDIPTLMGAAGASGEPEVHVLRPLDVDDNF